MERETEIHKDIFVSLAIMVYKFVSFTGFVVLLKFKSKNCGKF